MTETFGTVIRQARRALGLSQRQLAYRTGVDVTYLSKLENDHSERPPREGVVRALAEALELDPMELIYLAGRLPEQDEESLRQHYKGMTVFFRRIREDPAFAQRVFQEAGQPQSEDDEDA